LRSARYKEYRIAVFASGSGTNAQNLIEYFMDHDRIAVRLVVSNKSDARVLERARRLGVPAVVIDRTLFYRSEQLVDILASHGINFIVLAGFLWLVPAYLLRAFPRKIVNIHPALLPGYGGKEMYGLRVHEAVIAHGDKESGITIHYLNEEYDRGDIIFQARCPVLPDDTADTLASRVHELEYKHFPEVVERVILGTIVA